MPPILAPVRAVTTLPDVGEQTRTDVREDVAADRPWVTIVWDDPINLMNYVTHVFMQVFGYPRSKAHRLMLDVHTKGRAVVSNGTRERMELDVAQLHGYGLWATVAHDA